MAQPTEDTVVSKQLVCLLFRALDNLRVQYEEGAAQTAADRAFAAIRNAAKRVRLDPTAASATGAAAAPA